MVFFKQLRFVLAGLLVVLFGAALLPANADNKIALVVGNQDYPDLGDLPYAQINAQQLVDALSEVGFTGPDVGEPLKPSVDLTLDSLADQFYEFSEALQSSPEGTVGFVYFAGHGIAKERRGDVYLLATDSELRPGVDLDKVGIPVADVVELLRESSGRTIILVIDACRNVVPEQFLSTPAADTRSGATSGDLVVGGGWGDGPDKKVGLLKRGFQRDDGVFTEDRADYFVAFSTSPGRVAYDTDIFSSTLADEISAGKHDLFTLFKTVGERVAVETRSSGDLQLPTFEVGVYGTPPCFGSCRSSRAIDDTFFDCPTCPWIKNLESGLASIGSPKDEKGRGRDEPTPIDVSVDGFGVGIYEVTRAEWLACERAGACRTLTNKNKWQSMKAPIGGVTFQDTQDYIAWLNTESGQTYRLPTEVEWEFAARSGKATPFMTGDMIEPSQASYDYSASYKGSRRAEYRGAAESVGSFEPNRFGLFDMHGNMWEWACSDFTGDACETPILRGGSYKSTPADLRAANRFEIKPTKKREDVGFRVVRSQG